jgi:hypothetical protein
LYGHSNRAAQQDFNGVFIYDAFQPVLEAVCLRLFLGFTATYAAIFLEGNGLPSC